MFHNGFPSRKYAGQPIPEDVNFLDFAVYERPKYIPNSIPINKATPMLAHDRDGIIKDLVLNEGDQRYIVGFEDSPDLRVSVKMMDITNWVSARTFEEWHWQKTKEEEQRVSSIGMHWKQRKMLEKKGMTNGGESRENHSIASLAEVPDGLQPGMGLTGTMMSMNGPGPGPGPGRRRISDTGAIQTSRRQSIMLSPSSKRGRGLASQSSQLGLAQIPRSESGDIDEEEDEDNLENTEVALDMQFNDYGAGAQVSESDKSRSTSISIEIPSHPKVHHSQSHLSTSRKSTPTKAPSSVFKKPISTFSESSFSESATPSRKISPSKSSLSNSKPKTSQTKLKSFFLSHQTLNSSSSQKFRKRTPTPPVRKRELEEKEEEEDDIAWNVVQILDDETRTIDEDGTTQTYYLIKWEGEYEDTWEPSENVGTDLKKEYKRVKRKMRAAGSAAKSAEKRKRKRESEDRSGGSASRRRTTTSRSRSPLFINNNEMVGEEQDEIAMLPSIERRRQTSSGIKFHSKSRSKSKTPSKSIPRSIPDSRSTSRAEEQDDEGDTTMHDARDQTPVDERGLFISRSPTPAVSKKKVPLIDLRSSSEPEPGKERQLEPQDEVILVGGKAGVVNISSDEDSD